VSDSQAFPRRSLARSLGPAPATEVATPRDEGGVRATTDPRDVSDALFDQLSAEFGDRIDADTIRRVAIQEVALFEGGRSGRSSQ
jgi:hypothetical protein